uniref:Serine-threonine/tyrosine-protein kinase catalytic domain-containing protein n=1 Tax=Leersia perrieri TaxID=77586 RepID=A0A0D9V0I8_9ORYZ
MEHSFVFSWTNLKSMRQGRDRLLRPAHAPLLQPNADFLSGLGNQPEWSANNTNEINGADAAARFLALIVKLMNRTADLAAFGPPSPPWPRMYANGEIWCSARPTSPGSSAGAASPASSRRCRAPLRRGRILGVRCDLRYEINDNFFLETDATLKLDIPKKGLSTTLKIVVFGVPCLVLIISVVILRSYIVKELRELYGNTVDFSDNSMATTELLLQRDLVILEREIVSESDERFSLFKFSKIKEATDNFSDEKKLGQGGFGPVYNHAFNIGILLGSLGAASRIYAERKPGRDNFRGYITPEYFSQNVYSTRSDVFSFGILVLEIISGKRAVGSYKISGRSYELRRYAWHLWKEERCDELVDPSLGEDYQEMDIIRCIQVALLCVQDSAEDRPTMHDVTTMLSNRSRRLVKPAQPERFMNGST